MYIHYNYFMLTFWFQELLVLIGPHMTNIRGVSLEPRTLACVWHMYLGNTETFLSVADRFRISKGNLHHFVSKFNSIINDHDILSRFISWPRREHEYLCIAENFSVKAGFPDAIGAIDGTYIPISGPTSYREYNRKGYPAMHLKAVCDTDLKFLDVLSAYPGSVHDSRVFRNGPISKVLEEVTTKVHPLGDSAYPLLNELMTPFRDNGHLTLEEKKLILLIVPQGWTLKEHLDSSWLSLGNLSF